MKDTNANWARKQLEMHGVAWYPSTGMQFNKVVEEVGELAKAINQDSQDLIKSEMADVALALYNLADKFHIDLDAAIQDTVTIYTRKFGISNE